MNDPDHRKLHSPIPNAFGALGTRAPAIGVGSKKIGGQGIDLIEDVPDVATLVARLVREYQAACARRET